MKNYEAISHGVVIPPCDRSCPQCVPLLHKWKTEEKAGSKDKAL